MTDYIIHQLTIQEIWCSPEYRVEERAKIFCSMVIIVPSLRIDFQTFLFFLPNGRLLFCLFISKSDSYILSPPTQNIHYVAEIATIPFRNDTVLYIQLLLKLLTKLKYLLNVYRKKEKKYLKTQPYHRFQRNIPIL